MSSIKFEDKPENVKIREELRNIREELLKRAQNNAEKRPNKAKGKEATSILTDPVKKEKKNKGKHKHKKHKKSDREKSKDRHRSSSKKDHSDSEGTEEEEIVIQNKEEKDLDPSTELRRDDWMTSPMLVKTFSKNKPMKTNQCLDKYEPGTSSRELNPHWKNGGSGLPTFRKPKDDSDDDFYNKREKSSSNSYKTTTGGWKKTDTNASTKKSQDEIASSSSVSEKEETQNCLTDQEMNELGAKIMKAEILNNNELADELRNKLKSARLLREQMNEKHHRSRDKVKHGRAKSQSTISHRNQKDTENRGKPRTDRSGQAGKRVRNFDADDEYDIKNKFEREGKTTDSVKTAEKPKHFKEDLDDIFANTVQEDKEREIRNNTRSTKKLTNCDKCFDMNKINKQLVVSVGKHVYLALPWHEGLQTNHCLIIPIEHYSCSTELDEDVWEEVSNYRRVLTKLFGDRKEDVIFFETARYLQKRRHMVIHCVPSSSFEMAPFYFKKAIQESEYEWSKNKQLVMLKDKGLRRSIPNGLPYFWVNFGMDYGFAHVIEDQERFPSNFAQEIIGGMLELNMNKWRCPKPLHNVETKVKNLADLLKPYDLNIS